MSTKNFVIQPVKAELMLLKQFEEFANEKVPMSMKKPQLNSSQHMDLGGTIVGIFTWCF